MRNERGFALPLALGIMLVILVTALWANRGVIQDLWATIAQKQATDMFYAAEAGVRWALSNYLYTSVVDSLTADDPTRETTISVPTGEGSIQVSVSITFLGISRDCGFRAICCRRFEIKSQVQNGGPLVKFVGFKAIPNPEQDEDARRVCVM